MKTSVCYSCGEQAECPMSIGDIDLCKLCCDSFVQTYNDQLVPGKGGTVDSRELSTLRMGDGTGKPIRVVKDSAVFMYVGIGWVEERRATPEDCDELPMVVYPVPTVEHMARLI